MYSVRIILDTGFYKSLQKLNWPNFNSNFSSINDGTFLVKFPLHLVNNFKLQDIESSSDSFRAWHDKDSGRLASSEPETLDNVIKHSPNFDRCPFWICQSAIGDETRREKVEFLYNILCGNDDIAVPPLRKKARPSSFSSLLPQHCLRNSSCCGEKRVRQIIFRE